MKGISLAIETIVYVILAVTVLSVLLAFFLNNGIPPINEVELNGKWSLYCGRYIGISQRCDKDWYNIIDTSDQAKSDDEKILYNIAKACTGLNRAPQYCTNKNKASFDCVKSCCNLVCTTV